MLLLAYRTLKKECCKEYRCLNSANPALFEKSEWQADDRRRKWYVCYKWLVCIYLLWGLVHDWLLYEFNANNCKDTETACRIKWFVYCTSWAYLLLICQALMSAYLITWQPAATKKSEFSTFHRFYWIINNMAYALSLNVSLVYWTLVYSPGVMVLDFSNIKGHVTNSVLVLVDLMVMAQPVRLLHAYLPMTVGLLFAFFSAVFYLFGGTNRLLEEAIYPVYYWKYPLKAAYVGSCCEIGILLMHILVWLVFLLRSKLAQLVKNSNSQSEDESGVDIV
ncbi:Hypothetical predicted protein [Cloeon dipterum]|uniref:Protein rolling stone n=1 Tax=Cloeon dipterum TaxID=197152 RepID=A0A8S1C0Y2_9INSE|nr:Hypothetical predicted protein [Cloeon dipterum]